MEAEELLVLRHAQLHLEQLRRGELCGSSAVTVGFSSSSAASLTRRLMKRSLGADEPVDAAA
jgi:hypothetical protein